MLESINGPIAIAIISALAALATSVISVFSQRNKSSAETDAIASAEWIKLYQEMSSRLESTERRVTSLEEDLDIAKDTIQYLWLGNLENVRYMEAEGMTPPFKPKRADLRGPAGSDFDWIGDEL